MAVEAHPPFGNFEPIGVQIAGAAITQGQLLIMDNSGSGAGRAKPFRTTTGAFDTTAMEGGLLGFATHDADSGDLVKYQKILGGMQYTAVSYGAAPTATLLGVAPTTYYGLYLNAGVFSVDLGTTSNGVARFENFDYGDAFPFTNVAGTGNSTPDDTGGAVGDNVIISFPESVRFHK